MTLDYWSDCQVPARAKGQSHKTSLETLSAVTAFDSQKSYSAVSIPGNNLLTQIHTFLLDIAAIKLIPDDLVSHPLLYSFLSLNKFLRRGPFFAFSFPNSSSGLVTFFRSYISTRTKETLPHNQTMTILPPTHSFLEMLEDYELNTTKSGNFIEFRRTRLSAFTLSQRINPCMPQKKAW